jgi:hypothetical protein
MVRLNCRWADWEAESWTRMVTLVVPTTVGTPVMSPAPESDNPVGRVPAVILHVYPGVPPDAVKAAV